MKYLEFPVLDDYLNYLQQHGISATHIDLDSMNGKADEKLGVCAVTCYAVLTQVLEKQIITCGVIVGKTTNFHLKHDKHEPVEYQIIPKIRTCFENIKTEVQQKGFTTYPGIWKLESPNYLK